MDERALRTLRELRDRGSITAAAQAMNVSPSAVSQQMAALQRACAVPLTQKVGRRLQLTEAGLAVAARADAALRSLADVAQALAAPGAGPRPVVSVSAFHSAAVTLVPALLALPDAAVRFLDHDVSRERFHTLPGEVDVVIAHRSLHTDPWPPGLHVTPLLAEPFDIALGHAHPLAGSALDASNLAALEWIGVHGDFPLASALDIIAAEAGGPITVAHRINDFAVAATLMQHGNLACLLPRHTGSRYPDVVMHPVPGRAPGRRIDALTRADRLARPGVRRVLDELTRTARELVDQNDRDA